MVKGPDPNRYRPTDPEGEPAPHDDTRQGRGSRALQWAIALVVLLFVIVFLALTA
jgi:hypothetical protein